MNSWLDICPIAALPADRGVCALVEAGQVALFLVDGVVHAVGNEDPATGAMVMSRGIVGSRGNEVTVASPLHKQVYSLATGNCLDDAALALPVHEVRVLDGAVQVRLADELDVPATAVG